MQARLDLYLERSQDRCIAIMNAAPSVSQSGLQGALDMAALIKDKQPALPPALMTPLVRCWQHCFHRVASGGGVNRLQVSFFERVNNAHFNSLAMIDADGSVLGVYRKSHIPDGPG